MTEAAAPTAPTTPTTAPTTQAASPPEAPDRPRTMNEIVRDKIANDPRSKPPVNERIRLRETEAAKKTEAESKEGKPGAVPSAKDATADEKEPDAFKKREAKTSETEPDATEVAETEEGVEPRKVKFKADGEEIEMEESELIELGKKGKGLEKSLQRKLEEAAKERKIVDSEKAALMADRKAIREMVQDIKDNPNGLLEFGRGIGIDDKRMKQLIIDEAKKIIAWEKMPPAEREAITLREKLAARERQDAEARKAELVRIEGEKRAQKQAAARAEQERFTKLFSDELSKHGLPPDSDILGAMASLYVAELKSGATEPDIAKIALKVKGRFLGVTTASLEAMDEDALYNAMPKDVVQRLYKRHNETIANGGLPPVLKKGGQSAPGKPDSEKHRPGRAMPMQKREMTFDDMRENHLAKYRAKR